MSAPGSSSLLPFSARAALRLPSQHTMARLSAIGIFEYKKQLNIGRPDLNSAPSTISAAGTLLLGSASRTIDIVSGRYARKAILQLQQSRAR